MAIINPASAETTAGRYDDYLSNLSKQAKVKDYKLQIEFVGGGPSGEMKVEFNDNYG